MEVYERLIRENDADPAQLVISADTVVIFPPEKDTAEGGISAGQTSEILEKPLNKEEQYHLLDLMSGHSCEVVTGVCIGKFCSVSLTLQYTPPSRRQVSSFSPSLAQQLFTSMRTL